VKFLRATRQLRNWPHGDTGTPAHRSQHTLRLASQPSRADRLFDARAQCARCLRIDRPRSCAFRHHHAIVALRGLDRHRAVAHVREHALGIAQKRIAVAAARSVEPEGIVRGAQLRFWEGAESA
jgi:hypothetical protein